MLPDKPLWCIGQARFPRDLVPLSTTTTFFSGTSHKIGTQGHPSVLSSGALVAFAWFPHHSLARTVRLN